MKIRTLDEWEAIIRTAKSTHPKALRLQARYNQLTEQLRALRSMVAQLEKQDEEVMDDMVDFDKLSKDFKLGDIPKS